MVKPQCSVCLCDISCADRYTTKCGHIFHRSCMEEWLQHKKECPMCRSSVGKRKRGKRRRLRRRREAMSREAMLAEIERLRAEGFRH